MTENATVTETVVTVQQVSVFVPNEPGAIAKITATLADAGIDMRALSIADTRDYGILRIIVKNPEAAVAALAAAKYMAQITNVIGVKINDEPGKLNKALQVIAAAGVNLEYLYAFLSRTEKHAYVILRVQDNEAAGKALLAAGFILVKPSDVEKL